VKKLLSLLIALSVFAGSAAFIGCGDSDKDKKKDTAKEAKKDEKKDEKKEKN
jgi:hypothetical protein